MRNIRIDGTACLLWAMFLLVLPLKWLIAAVSAAMFHELCHYLAIRAAGGRVESLLIHPWGAIMETTPLEPAWELICALAGPLGGLLLLLFVRMMPLTALCALIQSAYNLLPIYPLDGGRALRCLVILLRPNGNPDSFCRITGLLSMFGLLSAAILAVWRFSLGAGVLLPLLILLGRMIPRKRPCKTPRLALQ